MLFFVRSVAKRASRRFALRNPELAASTFRSPLGLLRFVELAVLVGAGAAALVFQLRLPQRLPAEQDYRDVAATLERERSEGDVVLLYPWWSERARLFVPPALPVVGYLGSDTDPLRSFARIWLLAQPRLPKANLSDF